MFRHFRDRIGDIQADIEPAELLYLEILFEEIPHFLRSHDAECRGIGADIVFRGYIRFRTAFVIGEKREIFFREHDLVFVISHLVI